MNRERKWAPPGFFRRPIRTFVQRDERDSDVRCRSRTSVSAPRSIPYAISSLHVVSDEQHGRFPVSRQARFGQFASMLNARLEARNRSARSLGCKKSVPGAGIEPTRPFRDPGFKNKQARAITPTRSVQHWSAAAGMSGSTV